MRPSAEGGNRVTLLEKLFSLNGKTALVTGSSSGIGQAQAIALAEAGATVAIHGTSEEKIADTLQQIAAVGGKAIALPQRLDGDAAGCAQLVQSAAAQLGRLDILINCAGMNRRKVVLDVTEDDYDTIMSVNLKSLYFISQAAAEVMKAQGHGGKVLHIGSLTSFRGMGMLSVYGATKAATARLAEHMAVEWAKYNIQVNCLAPGFIETPLTAKGLFADPVRREWILDRVPAKRPGYPSDLIGATLFLCSPASDFVTGQTLAVDGGFLTGGGWPES
jgi:NAD(P)-dependent dehydrogenase (short-subunit alcohol dehydrogenase family)